MAGRSALERARLALAAALSRSAPQLGTSGLSRRGAGSTLPTAAQLRAGSRPGARSAGRGARGGDYYWVNERASGARGAATSACWRFLSLVALSSDVVARSSTGISAPPLLAAYLSFGWQAELEERRGMRSVW
jgi:hypothetical protein